jgi:CzcA family heavy metal efflux pump
VTLTFKDGTDVRVARQLAAERIASLGDVLPRGVKLPAILPLTSSASVILIVGLTSKDRSAMDLRTIADWQVRPRLLSVAGVADVITFGGEVKQFQIQVIPSKLVRHGLSLRDVLDAAARSTGVTGAGFLENDNQRIVINTEGQLRTPEQLSKVVVAYKGGVGVQLGDVATVKIAPAPRIGDASIMGEPAVMLIIESQYGANTMTVTREVEHALDGLKPALASEKVTVQGNIFRSANFIERAISHFRLALMIGGALVIVVLFLFLLDVRTAVISVTAIPLSLLTAVIVLHALGVSLNTMTLGGLAIALGEVVDDAIVDVENIHRRLRQNQARDHPEPAARVVLRASIEVRSAVVFATLIVAIAFLPVLSLTGVAGKLFAPLGIAYILAILASLAVALTVTPAMSFLLLTRRPLRQEEPALIRRLKTGYSKVLGRVEGRPVIVIAAIALLTVVALAMLPFFSGSFIPELKEGHYIVHMSAAPGTSLAESMRVGREITSALKEIRGVRMVAQHAGRASEVVDPAGPEVSEFEVDLEPMSGAEQTRALDAITRTVAGFPGLTTSVNTFLKERVDETISGSTAPIAINVFGNDLDVIDEKAQEIARIVSALPGAAGVGVQSPPGTPQLVIRLRPDRLSQWGFAPVDVLEAIRAANEGIGVAQVYEGNRAFDVSVILDPALRRRPADIGLLPLRNPEGLTIPLREVADITQSQGRSQVLHTQGQRVQTVSVFVRGRAVSDFASGAQREVTQRVSFRAGTYAVFSGEEEARKQSQRDLIAYFLMALVGIVLLLFMALKSNRAMLLVLVNLPFALVGGIVTVFLTGGNVSLGSMVGFVTLFGITLRNSIMLVSHYEHLVAQEGMDWGPEAAARGAGERLVPILMTALVTGLALLPLAIMSGEPGNEIEGPMAIVILGGLLTSTLLNLLVLPTLALRWGRFRRRGDESE